MQERAFVATENINITITKIISYTLHTLWHTGWFKIIIALPDSCYRGKGVRLYDGHRSNSGDGDSIHCSTVVAVTELMVNADDW